MILNPKPIKKKRTVGSIAYELLEKDFHTEDSQKPTTVEQTEAMQKNYYQRLINNVQHGRGRMSCDEYSKDSLIKCKKDKCVPFIGDFFIEVFTWKDKIMPNKINQFFVARKSCPTPNYDQAVFKYDAGIEQLSEIWVLGSRETCFYFMQNTKALKPEIMETFEYVRRFSTGELFRLSKRLNNEKDDSDELDVKPAFTVH